MDYNQLKTFTVIAHTRNLTQAAERLYLSQPAVSAQIKALETRLNVALFTRTANGMQLTPAGEVFLPEAEMLLQHHHRLDCFAQTLAAHYVAHAELGIIHPIDASKITRLTHAVLHDNPNLRLHIQYGMSGEIEQRILAKQLHGGFFLGPVARGSLRSVFLENIEYALICPNAWAAEIQAASPARLNDYAWIEMSGVSGSRKNLQQFWRQHRISPKHQIICDYPQTIIDLVCDGAGLAMVPTHKAAAARNNGKPITLIESHRQSLPLSFIYLDEYEQDPMLQLLKNSIATVWQAA